MVESGDDWTSSAMRDGGVVAELLLRLKEAKISPVLFANHTVTALRWGIRQPRSRSPRREPDSAKNSRCSPSTPLSWSAGGFSSPSAYADGYEATSQQTSSSFVLGSRSKVMTTEEVDSEVKKLRKKKTFAELREKESNLLTERIRLKKEITSLRATFKEEGTENDNLKRIKQLDLKSSDDQSRHLQTKLQQHKTQNLMEEITSDGNFLLPDLNMMPCEENSDHFSSLAMQTLFT